MTASTFQAARSTMDAYQVDVTDGSLRAPSDLRFPTLTATVPKEFVHRAAVAEVMLTNWWRQDETHFRVSAQWSRSHSFFTLIDGESYDPLMAAETIRQLGTLLAHAEFGLPLGHQFLVHDLAVAVRPEYLSGAGKPASLEIDVVATMVRQHRGVLAGMRLEVVIRRDDNIVATGGGSYTCLNPAVYGRLRGGRTLSSEGGQPPLIAPAAPQSVGRMSPMDVVLSPTTEANRWQLRVDTRHPVLFDHPLDHVPGMVLLEAARQATAGLLKRSSLLPLAIAGDFRRYVELNTPCMIEARRMPRQLPDGTDTILVTGHQDGALCFSATVSA